MAKGSGTTRNKRDGGLKPNDGNYKGKIGRPQSLKTIKNKAVYDAVMDAISHFHSKLGVRQRNFKIADLDANTAGVHVTRDGVSEGIYLNRSIFQPAEATTQSVASWAKAGYDSGHLTKTNKPVAHVILHEAGHAVWNEHLKGEKYQKAGKEIKQIFKAWKQDKGKEFYGRYANTNVSEWWSETCVKAVSGFRDKYTDSVKNIIRKYGL